MSQEGLITVDKFQQCRFFLSLLETACTRRVYEEKDEMDRYLGKTVWRQLPLANNNSPLIRPSYNLLAELRTRLDNEVIPSHVCVGSPATYRLATSQRTSVSHLAHIILVLTSNVPWGNCGLLSPTDLSAGASATGVGSTWHCEAVL